MLVVRFPDGTSIQYNQANYLKPTSEAWHLYTSESGDWVATVPFNCIVEARPACRVYNALRTNEQLRILLEGLREMSWSELSIAVELKRKLAKFNSRTRTWRS